MTTEEYEQLRRECWKEFCDEFFHDLNNTCMRDWLDWIFDRAYALGKQTETITQNEIEQAAEEYVFSRQKARHNAQKDATMRDFDKTLRAWDAYDMEQAYEEGANFALGKQEKDADTVIQGWVARNGSGPNDLGLRVYTVKPDRMKNRREWNGHGEMSYLIDCRLFPDLTWNDEPIKVSISIKRE